MPEQIRTTLDRQSADQSGAANSVAALNSPAAQELDSQFQSSARSISTGLEANRAGDPIDLRIIGNPVAIMQPYFLPYLGYFQLLAAVRTFVIYDDVQYIKGGWINRNRILIQEQPHFITLPLEKASPNKSIQELTIAETGHWRKKMRNAVRSAYGRAPHYREIFPAIQDIIDDVHPRLADFLENSLRRIAALLGISTEIVKSSDVLPRDEIRGADRVLAICKNLEATAYINAIGGKPLYLPAKFQQSGVSLHFLKSGIPEYPQQSTAFTPSLSIVDVLMFNGVEGTRKMLDCFSLE